MDIYIYLRYWNNVDDELELDMDVLDDLCGEVPLNRVIFIVPLDQARTRAFARSRRNAFCRPPR